MLLSVVMAPFVMRLKVVRRYLTVVYYQVLLVALVLLVVWWGILRVVPVSVWLTVIAMPT